MPKEARNKKQEIDTKDAETSSLDHVLQLITSKTEEIRNSIDGKLTEEIRKLNKQLEDQKNDILSIRDVIIKNLQEENDALRHRIENLEDEVAFIESDIVTPKDEHIASYRNSFSDHQYMRLKEYQTKLYLTMDYQWPS